jgi:hypothetical protein
VRVYGLDFTSNPCSSKHLTLAECDLNKDVLTVKHLHPMRTEEDDGFSSFESWLSGENPWTEKRWIAGLDFPFGMALEAIQHFGWVPARTSNPRWENYLGVLFQTKCQAIFREKIEGWRHTSKMNDKREFVRVRRPRLTDRLANSGTPMNFYPPVVCPMFFQGTKRLLNLATNISILPVRAFPTSQRTIVDAYPRLVANVVIRNLDSYKEKSKKKHEDKATQAVIRREDEKARENRRRAIIKAFSNGAVEHKYGFRISISKYWADKCIEEDIDGDKIDSVLCAIQAAWAHRHPDKGMPKFGLNILQEQIRLEGWIADPYVFQRFKDGES